MSTLASARLRNHSRFSNASRSLDVWLRHVSVRNAESENCKQPQLMFGLGPFYQRVEPCLPTLRR